MAAHATSGGQALPYELAGKRVWVAGHRGMVGAALLRRLVGEGCEILSVDRGQLDLRRQHDVERWMRETRPQAVFLAAATVGGIRANDRYPADFLYDNLLIEANIIHGARETGAEKLLFLGSSCIYPRLAPQPMAEEALLTGPLEPTNQWYAIAKIAGIRLCQSYRRQHGCDFISAMPTNLYGPNDDFDLETSHVLPALLVKADRAKRLGGSFEVCGSGDPLREFMHIDDLADALVHLMKTYSDESHINVGSGQELSIHALAELVAAEVGFEGEIVFRTEYPDGAPRKALAGGRLAALGWQPRIGLAEGIAATYRWYLDNVATCRPHGRGHCQTKWPGPAEPSVDAP